MENNINSDNMDNTTSSLAFEPTAEQGQSTVVSVENEHQNDSPMMDFEPKYEQTSYIKVIGVGGGGGNAVNHMYRQGIHGVDFIVCNTDMKALNSSPVPNKIELGKLGAGNVPERARKAALEHKEEIINAISHNTQMLFITAGMGGGTGTGAAPVIAELAKSIQLDDEEVPRILVVAIVTMPFTFEGRRRKEQAIAGIKELKKHVDSILIINNDKLRSLGNLPLNQAFSKADDVLLTAAKGIAEIITVSAYVNIDFRDVNTVMEKSGTALMGAGSGTGETRAKDAIQAATTSVLLDDNDIRGAKNILLYFSYSPSHQINMDELGEVTDYLTSLTGNPDTNVIWGAGDDESLNDDLKITLIATGFEQKPEAKRINLDEVQKPLDNNNKPQPTTPTVPEASADKTADNSVKETETMQSKHIIPLGEIEDDMEDDEVSMVSEEEATKEVAAPVAEQHTGSKLLDGIRVVPRDIVHQQTPQNVAAQTISQPMAQATVATSSVLFEAQPMAQATVATPAAQSTSAPQATLQSKVETPQVSAFDVFGAMPEAEVRPVQPQNTVQSQSPMQTHRNVNQALTPETPISESKLMDRAERIRRMNELLHNDPKGPDMVEALTPEQLTGEPIYETQHSSVSDVSRTSINANGNMVNNVIFLQDLPD